MESKINQVIIDAVHDVCKECCCRKNCTQKCYEVVKMVSLASDIERIARQEERERCIKAAQDAHCVLCNYNDGICGVCTSFYECDERDMIRIEMKKKLLKMEGGE